MADPSTNVIQAPEWLDKTFVENALRKSSADDNLVVTEFNIKPAVGVGDNYSSRMFRVNLTIKNEKGISRKNVIIKSLPGGEKMIENVKESDFFGIESMMLSEVLPKMQKILSEAGKFPVTFPQCLYHQGDPNNLLILEDLKDREFAVANRFMGLDVDHCVLVLESLAAHHASSIALVRQDPEIKKKFRHGFWHRDNRSKTEKFLIDSLGVVTGKIDKWSDTKHSQKLAKLQEEFLEKFYLLTDVDENGINVLTHGDLWTSNIMFQYNSEKKPISLTFVDFQMSAYTNPLIDVLYFIFTSATNDVRVDKYDFLLEAYHSKLQSVCKTLNCDVAYSFEDFKQDAFRRLLYAFVIGLSVFPIACAPPEDALEVDIIEDEDSLIKQSNIFNNKRFINGALKSIPFFEKHGVL